MRADIKRKVIEKIEAIALKNDLKIDYLKLYDELAKYRDFRTFQYMSCEYFNKIYLKYEDKRRKTITLSCTEFVEFQYDDDINHSLCYNCMIHDILKRIGLYQQLYERDTKNGRIKLFE